MNELLTAQNIYIVSSLLVFIYFIYIVSLPEKKENFVITSLKENLSIINPEFKKLDIRESDSSYTEDKSVIYLCLKNENGETYPLNTIIYVALHEIAHYLNKSDYGHTEKFQEIFNDLLCKASEKGIYDPSKPHSSFYCGVDIRGISMPSCKI
jgi:hypothetical protein